MQAERPEQVREGFATDSSSSTTDTSGALGTRFSHHELPVVDDARVLSPCPAFRAGRADGSASATRTSMILLYWSRRPSSGSADVKEKPLPGIQELDSEKQGIQGDRADNAGFPVPTRRHLTTPLRRRTCHVSWRNAYRLREQARCRRLLHSPRIKTIDTPARR